MDLRLGVLASGGGSNFGAIHNSIYDGSLRASMQVVISNNSSAGVLGIAESNSVPWEVINGRTIGEGRYASRGNAILQTLKEKDVSHVILAGYMRKLEDEVIQAYPNRVLNIYPAIDLKRFGGKGMCGMRVHEAVLAAEEGKSGASVHLVDGEYDHGRIVGQVQVDVFGEDTPESLQARVLRYEHVLYSQVLRDIREDRIDLDYKPLDPDDIPF